MRHKLCVYCGSPVKPWNVKKKPNEYDHCSGCPAAFDPHKQRRCSICEHRNCDLRTYHTGIYCNCPCHLLRGVALGAVPFRRDHKGNIHMHDLRRWLLALELAFGGTSWQRTDPRIATGPNKYISQRGFRKEKL